MNITEKIEDELVKHDLALVGYERQALADAMLRLTNLQGEVVQLIKDLDPTEPARRGDQRRRLERLLGQIDQRINRVYGQALRAHESELVELAVLESEAARRKVQKVVRAPLLTRGVTRKLAIEIVTGAIIPNDNHGGTLRERWRRNALELRTAIRNGMRSALERGNHITQMLQIVRGNRNVNFRDGVLFKSRSAARTLIRTAGAQITNASRLATYRRNADVLAGYQAKAVLDARTSHICLTRNGYAWRIDGRAMRGTPEPFPGSPPWHYNCRTTLIPIFKSLRDLQGAIEDPRLNEIINEVGEDFSFDGNPAADLTFEQWLARRSPADQRRQLGAGKYDLWKEGKISLTDLVNSQGQPLTLAQLRQKVESDE